MHKVSPVIEGGAYPAKAVVGESIPIRATVFREGHDAVNASVVLTDPDGDGAAGADAPHHSARLRLVDRVGDSGQARATGHSGSRAGAIPGRPGCTTPRSRFPAGIDVDWSAPRARRCSNSPPSEPTPPGPPSRPAAAAARPRALTPGSRSRTGWRSSSPTTSAPPWRSTDRASWSPRPPDYPIYVDRQAALFSSWYEFFPRSQGAEWDEESQTWTSGTFDSSYERLEAAAAMGFDVVYLPPIHPIGTSFRKGPNNTLDPGPADPGSPWAIGNVEGGHDAIHPDLGDFDSFDRFVAKAKSLGLEVAMDFALQASPDHPWVTEHPEWFSQRADGSIAYAENPPKKYQDIYPINFDNDRDGIYLESLRILKLWMSHGVRIFRVDNPHTKPVNFWAWLIAEVRRTDPDVLFLAEAFTKPAMMHALGKAGFQQSYTYFTWRNEKWEIEEYLNELTTETDSFFRPSFWVNTPDILPTFLQWGGRPAFTIRAVLAATLSPLWGVYSGYELFENAALAPGREEYLDSEKFQYRPARLEGGRGERREPQPAARQAEPDPQGAPRTAAAARPALPHRAAQQRARLLQAAPATTWSSWWSASTRTTSSRPSSTSTWKRSG